jgi:hypothetical protein
VGGGEWERHVVDVLRGMASGRLAEQQEEH